MRYRKPKMRNLWLLFVTRTFFTLIGLMLTGSVCVLIFKHLGLDQPRPIPMGGLFALLFISVGIGMMATGIVAHTILKPVQGMSDATKQIASGDFSIRLETDSNIREIVNLYDNFNKMVVELNGIETLRSDFVDNVSHEFKTPLASIEGYATLLSNPTLSDSEKKECTDSIIRSARQLSELVSNILKLSKLDNQQIIVDKHSFSLDEQIRKELLALEPLWSAKDIELDIELEEAQWQGSEELMAQVWINLLTNAMKFSPDGGTISVRLMQTPSRIRVMIRDQGKGMSLEEQRHIFEKFYQADRARSSEGNGLGLTLVNRILDLSGGKISVESAPGKGSVFTVSLSKAE